MNSWWDLGEGIGFGGSELAIYRIECPFCGEKGNFSTDHHVEKRNPNSSKVLNFDTLKCENCAGYVMVLWSATTTGGGGLHDYRPLPFPLKTVGAPEHWPQAVQRGWFQAHRSLEEELWDSAAERARSALQAALRDQNARGRGLIQEIDGLANQGILPPLMREWSHEVRLLGNISTHPEPQDEGVSPEDAKDIVEFLDYILEYLYDLPKRIEDYRNRRRQP